MLQGKLAGQSYNTQVRSSTAEQLKALALAPPHVYIYLAIVKKILNDEQPASSWARAPRTTRSRSWPWEPSRRRWRRAAIPRP